MEAINEMSNAELNTYFEAIKAHAETCESVEQVIQYIERLQRKLEKPIGNADTNPIG